LIVFVLINFHLDGDFAAAIDQAVGLLGADAFGADRAFLGITAGAGLGLASAPKTPADR